MAIYLYERKILNDIEVTQKLTDIYYGYAEPQTVEILLSNADGYFTSIIQSEEIRRKVVTLRRYEPEEGIRFEVSGVITDYELSKETLKIVVSIDDPDPFQKEIPSKVLETSDWSWGQNPTAQLYLPSKDIGRPYPLCFGYCRKVPALYVKCDYDNDHYDYIISYGEIEDVVNVYRNGRLVDMSQENVTYHAGTSSSPYSLVINGQTVYFAYIRFRKEQKDYNGNLYEITVDLKGMKLGSANMQKNFADVIRHLISNQAWGLGLTINTTSFTQASTDVANRFPEVNDHTTNIDGGCCGSLTTPMKAYDIINELLLCCGGRLGRTENNAISLTIDTYQARLIVTLGDNDGYYNNANVTLYKRKATGESIKTWIVNYGYNTWNKNYSYVLKRDCRTFGEEKTIDLNFVADHTTADRIIAYLQQLEQHDIRIRLIAGMEAREADVGDVVRLIAPDYNIDDMFRIIDLKRNINSFEMMLSDYSQSIYIYNPSTLPVDLYPDTTPDYSFTPPSAPTNLQIVASGTAQGSDGKTYAYVRLQANAPSANFTHLEFGRRQTGLDLYQWIKGEHISGSTWQAVIDGLTPGLNYDYGVVAVNQFGLRSTITTLNNRTSPGDTSAPPTPTGPTGRCKGKTYEFQWNAVTAADLRGYQVQLNSSNTFGGTMYLDGIVDAPKVSYTNDSLAYGTTIYCRVRSVDFTGNTSAWSSTASAQSTKYTGGAGGDIATNTITADNIVNNTISEIVTAASEVGITLSTSSTTLVSASISCLAGDDLVVIGKTYMSVHFGSGSANANIVYSQIYLSSTLLDESTVGFSGSSTDGIIRGTATCIAFYQAPSDGNYTFSFRANKTNANELAMAYYSKIMILRVRR